MHKVMAFLVGRPGLSLREVADHYETRHVPLILSRGPAPRVYKRNYVLNGDGEVDVITELQFTDEAAYRAWVALMYAPDSGVAADEATFLDRSRTRSFTVEEHVTGG